MNVDPASISITFDKAGAKPAFFVSPTQNGLVQGHLTKGFTTRSPDTLAPAWTATAKFKVTLGPKETMAGAKFGFLQSMKVKTIQMRYAGVSKRDGFITLGIAKPPALAQSLLLDSDVRFTPFTRPAASRFTVTPPSSVTCSTGDHPSVRAKLTLKNTTTSVVTDVNNFLLDVTDNREFVTVLTMQDPTGKVQLLAHFRWEVFYSATLQWKQNALLDTISVKSLNSTSALFGQFTQ